MALRQYREKAGLTQQELADLCGISAGVVGHYERGLKTPRIQTAHTIIQALRSHKVKVTVNDLFPPA